MNHEDNPKSIKYYVKKYLIAHQDELKNKQVIDLPAGHGVTSRILKEIGAHPVPMDLFPEYFNVEGLTCQKADIQDRIPSDDKSSDYVVCQEGIEHFSDQLHALKEFSRVLKIGGSLLVTTPNYSSIRSRLSYFLSESERYNKIMPPNELESVWFSNDDKSDEIYLGHVFLIGIQKLRMLARLSGFEIVDIQFTRARPTSTALLPVFYPFIFLSNWINYRKNLKKKDGFDKAAKKKIYREIFKLGTNTKLLVGSHLFVRFEKKMDVSQVKENLLGYAAGYERQP
jgi:SAM-dependent methyltransferase